ncbi:MAG: hypothetical protein IJ615_11310 [Bacteroidaceae bacterium]|nr:hypothetical protein [Bacteroidaceae bacterium]
MKQTLQNIFTALLLLAAVMGAAYVLPQWAASGIIILLLLANLGIIALTLKRLDDGKKA